EVCCTIQRVELGISGANIFWVNLSYEWRRQVPHVTVRVNLQDVEPIAMDVPNNIDAKHRTFRECFMRTLTQPDDLRIIAECTDLAHRIAVCCDYARRVCGDLRERWPLSVPSVEDAVKGATEHGQDPIDRWKAVLSMIDVWLNQNLIVGIGGQ